MKRHKIEHFASNSDLNTVCVERFNRTIKTRLYAYMTAKSTNRWVEVLLAIINSYNLSRHRGIGIAPADVRKRTRIGSGCDYGDGDTIRKRIDPLPDETMVRINLSKTSFDKGYLRNLTQKHFIVAGRSVDSRRPVNKLKDYDREEVKGVWYPEEIKPITANEYRIERVIKRRRGARGIVCKVARLV